MSKKNLTQWVDFHAFSLLAGALATCFSGKLEFLLFSGIVSFVLLIYWNKTFLSQYRPFGGWANWVTFLRLLILTFCGLNYDALNPYLLYGLLMLILGMDLLDGYLAKKWNTASEFGMYFDMETDAFYVLILTFILYFGGLMPSWILGVGLLRPLNAVAKKLVFKDGIVEQKVPLAAFIAGLLFLSLPLAFVLKKDIYFPVITLSSVLVCFSFGYVFLGYFSKKP